MKKIVFLTSTLEYGGATKIMVRIANYLAEYYEILFLCYGDKGVFYNIDKRIHIEWVPKTKCKIRKVRLITQLRLIRNSLSKIKPDLIIAFGNTEKLFAVLSALGTNSKVLISERQDPYNYIPGKRNYMYWRYEKAEGCVFQTEGARDYFSDSVKKKSIVIPNFIEIDLTNYKNIKKRKEISFSARFELRQKRQDVMVRAFQKVYKRHPEYKLVFYGDGPDQTNIENLVMNLGLQSNVVFAGKTANVLSKIAESDVFVISSDYEGIPNALLEAMALGIPSVSTDCSPGGARLLIEDGINGLLVPCRDEDKLAKAIIRLIEDRELYTSISQSTVKVLSNYSSDKILESWKKYLDTLL